MEDIPSTAAAAAAAAAAPDPSRPAPPAAAASDTVSTGDIMDSTSSSISDVVSDEEMMAMKERFYALLGEKDSKRKTEAHIVRGRPRHPQSQGGIERSNAQYKTGLQFRLQEKKTT